MINIVANYLKYNMNKQIEVRKRKRKKQDLRVFIIKISK